MALVTGHWTVRITPHTVVIAVDTCLVAVLMAGDASKRSVIARIVVAVCTGGPNALPVRSGVYGEPSVVKRSRRPTGG